jgi:uncharacterized membrane protein HdeD (DUF308 family)
MADTDVRRPASPITALAWGALAIGGILAIVLGLVAIVWPDTTLRVLVVFLGAYAFISGIFTVLVGAVWPPGWGLRWPMVLQGVLGIVVGVLIFLRPETAALVLIYVVAAWAIISGLLQIAAAVRLRRVIPDEWFFRESDEPCSVSRPSSRVCFQAAEAYSTRCLNKSNFPRPYIERLMNLSLFTRPSVCP